MIYKQISFKITPCRDLFRFHSPSQVNCNCGKHGAFFHSIKPQLQNGNK